jgi:prepilin-type N-terminal cleavage/methylation domain-containing protein
MHTNAAVRRTRGGFTMVELLVVIAIIVLLVALLFVVGQPLRQTAHRTKCLIHQRTIALACQVYATDNAGRYASPRTDTLAPETGMGKTPHSWVNCTQSAGTLINNVEQKGSMEKGTLWAYMNNNYEAYRSPLDPTKRVRSYSLSSFIGVGGCDPNPGNKKCDDLYTYGYKTVSSSTVRQPAASMMVISEEDAPGYNRHGWVLECFNSPLTYKWVDLPSFWDGNRVNMAMMDGSTKSIEILSPKLIKAMQSFGNNYVEPSPAPAYRVMRQYTLPGSVPF